jgi:hypothetical protein
MSVILESILDESVRVGRVSDEMGYLREFEELRG